MYRSGCDLGTLHTHVYCESDVFCPLENRVKPFDIWYNLFNVELRCFHYRKKTLTIGLEFIEKRKRL
jgi:hypothetical protein